MIGVDTLVAVREDRKKHDWYLLGSACALMIIGVLMIHSHDMAVSAANVASGSTPPRPSLAEKFGGKGNLQAIYGVIGVVLMALCSLANAELWQRLAKPMWWVNNILLVWVIVHGTTINHAKRWITLGPITLQPSDFSNIFIVVSLTAFFMANQEGVGEKRTIWKSFLYGLPSIGMILIQPHAGGSFCQILAWLAIMTFSGIPPKRVILTIVTMGLSVSLLLSAPNLIRPVMPPYWGKRLDAFAEKVLGKKTDSSISLQQVQSEIAIANGGLTGRGYGKGDRTNGRFIPEQESDFVFSLVGEQFGLLGSLGVLTLYGLFFYRIWLIIHRSKDRVAQMIAAGFTAILGFHVIANLSMVLNVGFTIGLWLPFMSSGGTALIASLVMVGILDSLEPQH